MQSHGGVAVSDPVPARKSGLIPESDVGNTPSTTASPSLFIELFKVLCFAWGCLLLALSGILLGAAFLALEAGYRFFCLFPYLTRRTQKLYSKDLNTCLWCYSFPIWEYDEQFGYRYKPNQNVNIYLVHQGKPVPWTLQWRTNELGNISKTSAADFETANVRGLVFGDSFSVYPTGDEKNATWSDLLQEKLSAKWNCKVGIHNFARDGYGLLQMVDLAAAMVPKYRPDFIIFGLISSDFDRDRSWRAPIQKDVHGKNRDKVIFSPEMQEDLMQPEGLDGVVINQGLSCEVFQEILSGKNTHQDILDELEEQRIELDKKLSQKIRWLSLSDSFLFNKIFLGDPFISFKPPVNIPLNSLTDFRDDSQFVENLNKIKSYNIPIFAVMLPLCQDLHAGRLNLTFQQQKLYRSFEKLLGDKIHDLTPQYGGSRQDINAHYLLHIAGDPHPSKYGLDFYASAVADKFN